MDVTLRVCCALSATEVFDMTTLQGLDEIILYTFYGQDVFQK